MRVIIVIRAKSICGAHNSDELKNSEQQAKLDYSGFMQFMRDCWMSLTSLSIFAMRQAIENGRFKDLSKTH
jgi:acyl-CoA hydrolase